MSVMAATFTVLLLLPVPKPDAQAAQPPSIRQTLAKLDYGAGTASIRKQATTPPASAPKRQRSLGRKITGGVLGAVGGFIAGAYTGNLIEGLRECRTCEPSPLPTGAIIGAPIGAIIGGILGAKFL